MDIKPLFSRPTAWLVLICLVLAPSLALCRDMPGVKEISAREAEKIINEKPANLIILDVRTPAEFREGHIAGAKNLDFFGGRFDVEAASLPKDSKVLVYCRSGMRSAGAVEELHKAGIKELYHLSQGMDEWQRSKLPVTK